MNLSEADPNYGIKIQNMLKAEPSWFRISCYCHLAEISISCWKWNNSWGL